MRSEGKFLARVFCTVDAASVGDAFARSQRTARQGSYAADAKPGGLRDVGARALRRRQCEQSAGAAVDGVLGVAATVAFEGDSVSVSTTGRLHPSDSDREIDPRIRQHAQHLGLEPLVAAGQDGHADEAEQQREPAANTVDARQHPVTHAYEALA